MTTGLSVGGETDPVRGHRSTAVPCARHTLGLVIRMSANVLETGRYGAVRDVTWWKPAFPKTPSDLHK